MVRYDFPEPIRFEGRPLSQVTVLCPLRHQPGSPASLDGDSRGQPTASSRGGQQLRKAKPWVQSTHGGRSAVGGRGPPPPTSQGPQASSSFFRVSLHSGGFSSHAAEPGEQASAARGSLTGPKTRPPSQRAPRVRAPVRPPTSSVFLSLPLSLFP